MTERRNRGFLTAKDRDTLEKKKPDQYPPHFRTRTREKLRQAIADFDLVSKKLEDEDVMSAFEVLSDPDQSETTSYSHEPFTRDTIVNGLSLFFQATDLVTDSDDTELKNLIRDATIQAYRRTRSPQVIGSVDINIEVDSRQEAYERGYEKYRDGEWLTPTELRALVDAEYEIGEGDSSYDSISDASDQINLDHSEMVQYVVDHLSEVEPGLKLKKVNQSLVAPQTQNPDIICEDQDGKIVLIKIYSGSPHKNFVKEFEATVSEYGKSEQTRAVIISQSRKVLTADIMASDVDVRALRVDRLGTIHGIVDVISS